MIFIGNEYAKGNPKTVRQRQQAVEDLCRRPDMAKAIAELKPEGLGRNKQLVADLVRKKQFFLLSQMYRLKNRI